MYSYLVMMNPLPILFAFIRLFVSIWRTVLPQQKPHPSFTRKTRRRSRFSPIMVLPGLFCCYLGVMMSTHSFILGIGALLTEFPSLTFASRVYHRRLFGTPRSKEMALPFWYFRLFHPHPSHRSLRWRRRKRRRALTDLRPADDDPPPFGLPKPPDPDPIEELSFTLLFPAAVHHNAQANTAKPSTEGAPLAWSFLSEPTARTFPVTVDTGATITISPHRDDFVEYTELSGSVLQGLAKGLEINGTGLVRW